MAKKWQKVTALRKRRSDASLESDACSTPGAAKGNFIVYTSEGKRFMVPLSYIHSTIFRELFKLAEEEYGLPGNGPIRLPCDAVFMEHALSLLRRRVPTDVEVTLLSSMVEDCFSSRSLVHVGQCQQATCSF